MNHQLGKYTILAELGRGGFGTVYKAEDPIGRIVALKVLHPGWDQQPDVLMRFRREAMAGGSLFHQRIATILDIEETEGQLYLVMRYVEGKTLREEIKIKGKLSWSIAKKIIEEIAEGLSPGRLYTSGCEAREHTAGKRWSGADGFWVDQSDGNKHNRQHQRCDGHISVYST